MPHFGEHRNWNQELQLLLRTWWGDSASSSQQLQECGKSLEKAVLVPLSSPGSEENSSEAYTSTASAAQAGDTHAANSRSAGTLGVRSPTHR